MNRKQAWNVITLFCIMIFGFTVATFLKPDAQHSESENRDLAQMPKVTLESVLSGDFEADYEKYLTDQFVGRDGWIGLKTGVERATGRRESKDIYFAKDDYLIEKHTGSFATDTARQNVRVLGQFAKQYQDRFESGHMTFMVIPNAVDILSDKLPPFASPYDEEQYLKELEAVLPEGMWFDAAAVLREHKEEEIYYRTDHHWTTLAAFYTYQAWAGQQGGVVHSQDDYEIETVTDSFEGTIQSKLGIRTEQDSIELYQHKEDIFYTVEKNGNPEITYSLYDYPSLRTKSKYNVFFGGNHALVKIATRQNTGKRILVVKDSYAHCFVPFLLDGYDQIDMLDIRYYNQKLSELIAEGEYTDFLFLYNASGFAEDTGISRLIY